jgi:polysaccharide export outer membrane protein
MKQQCSAKCLILPALVLWLSAPAFAQASAPAADTPAAAPSAAPANVSPADPVNAPAAGPANVEQDTPATPQLKEGPDKVLQNFEPAADAEYELGPGDQIMIDIPGRPELTGSRIVGPDGRITMPLAGPIDLNNKTREQAAKAIEDALASDYTNLSVTVSVEKYGSNRIIVMGNVEHPGVFYFDDTPTLLDAVSRGGLLPASNVNTSIGVGNPGSVTRDGIPDIVKIYRGNDQVLTVQLRQMLESGNSLADMRLKRNDIVFVPSQQEIFVSVLGQVGHPGAIPLTPQSTLASVLAQAGGMAEGAEKNIHIIQPASGKTLTISYKQLLTAQGTNEVTLHSGDVVYVGQSGMYKATYIIQRISPLATLGTVAALAF